MNSLSRFAPFFCLTLTFVLFSCDSFFNPEKVVIYQSPESVSAVPDSENPLPDKFQKPNQGSFSTSKMLVNIGINIIHPAVEEFRSQADLLMRLSSRNCKGLEDTDDSTKREQLVQEVKEQWTRTMLSFHYVDAIPVGPLMSGSQPMRRLIYSWPYLNRCAVDLVLLDYKSKATIPEGLTFSKQGLGAIEYLLFEPSLESACNPRANPQVVPWNELPEEQKIADRCGLVSGYAERISKKANELSRLWDPNRANYSKSFVDGSVYESIHKATNAVSDALFSIETVKDKKLGAPLGFNDCFEDICPWQAEHSLSGLAIPAIRAQILAFRNTIRGSQYNSEQGFGFDDYLAEEGQPQIGRRMIRFAEESISILDALPPDKTLQQLINEMNVRDCHSSSEGDIKVPICGAFFKVKKAATVLKSEALAVLSLEAPDEFTGDND